MDWSKEPEITSVSMSDIPPAPPKLVRSEGYEVLPHVPLPPLPPPPLPKPREKKIPMKDEKMGCPRRSKASTMDGIPKLAWADELKPVEPPKQKTVDMNEFRFGFDCVNRGAASVLNSAFKQELVKAIEDLVKTCVEKKIEPKNVKVDWAPIQQLCVRWTNALGEMYLTKTQEILSMGPGQRLEVTPHESPVKEPVKKKEESMDVSK